jgi:Holliday junction DNA helicase RuvA
MNLDYIRGTLTDSSPSQVTIETHGLGVRLFISTSTFGQLGQTGQTALLYVATIIREDSHRLYGFLTKNERNFFETLNEISGIGPKLALALLGRMSLDDLQLALHQGNAKVLASVPGIGTKTAQKLIIELRDKVGDLVVTSSGHATDAISALINLGQNPVEAQKIVKTILENEGEELPLSQLISLALKHSSRRK